MKQHDLQLVGECVNRSGEYAYKEAWRSVRAYIKALATAPNTEERAENSSTSPVQQLKAEIRSSLDELCSCSPLEIPKAIDKHVARLRELSAV
jgi:hypothetical protein